MPQRTRNKGVALSVGLHWLSNFIIVYGTPAAIDHLGFRLYIIWAVLNAGFVPITWLFYPETAGRSLEDMSTIFACEIFGITETRHCARRLKDEAGQGRSTLRSPTQAKNSAIVVRREEFVLPVLEQLPSCKIGGLWA